MSQAERVFCLFTRLFPQSALSQNGQRALSKQIQILPKKYPRHPCPAFIFIVLSMLVNFCGFSPGYKFILLINQLYTSKKKIQSLNTTDHQSRNWASGIEVTDSLF